MFKLMLSGLIATLPVLCQIPGVRVGMGQDEVAAAVKGQDVIKTTDSRDKTQNTWSFVDSAGMNIISFQSGKVVAMSANGSLYRGDGRDLVKKLYSLLYLMTKSTPTDERTATATVALIEYPDVTGGEPIRHIELRFGVQHIDLTDFEVKDSSSVAVVSQGTGHAPSPGK